MDLVPNLMVLNNLDLSRVRFVNLLFSFSVGSLRFGRLLSHHQIIAVALSGGGQMRNKSLEFRDLHLGEPVLSGTPAKR